ncbi:MAG: hypothetical protein K0Q53_718 [Massilibacillus sp.]|jgi:NhaP-type Na+/H+ or K+/H+ antiporter|nr:hypothetical protein [Massilibacillus sp.]
MKDLLACMKCILTQTVISLLLCGLGAYVLGKAYLVMPIIAGCIVGGACWFIIAYRITKSADLSGDEAKKSMQFGWVIRLFLILGTLIMAIRISVEMFWAVVIGLFLISVIMMVNAIVFAYNSNANNKK